MNSTGLPPALTRSAPAGTPSAAGARRPLPPFVAQGGFSSKEPSPMIPDLSPVVSTAPEAPAVEPESDGTFPLDAFIIPEDARRVPAGFAASGEEENQTDHAIRMVAETLERFAMDLRRDGPDSLTRQLSSNDELEALLSAVLTGYIARHSG